MQKIYNHFITGATGILGSEYLAQILEQFPNDNIWLLVKADDQDQAESKISHLLSYLYPNEQKQKDFFYRIKVLNGDLAQDKMGLSDLNWNQLVDKTDYIVHAASITDCSQSSATINQVNIEGTRRVLDFAKVITPKQLKKIIYISSAYVNDKNQGLLFPEQMETKEGKLSPYQRSKYNAEKMIRDNFYQLPLIIVRPSYIVGNSENGRVPKQNSFHKLLQEIVYGDKIKLPIDKAANWDIITSDWAAKMMVSLLKSRARAGQNYHLTMGDYALSSKMVKTEIHNALNAQNFSFNPIKLLPSWQHWWHRIFAKKSLQNNHPALLKTMRYKRVFDNSSSLMTCHKSKIDTPKLKNYLPKIISYAQTHFWCDKVN